MTKNQISTFIKDAWGQTQHNIKSTTNKPCFKTGQKCTGHGLQSSVCHSNRSRGEDMYQHIVSTLNRWIGDRPAGLWI